MVNENNYLMTEEQFVALLYSLGLFKEISDHEEVLYEELLLLLSVEDQEPFFTLRNTKALVLAINGIHYEWMGE